MSVFLFYALMSLSLLVIMVGLSSNVHIYYIVMYIYDIQNIYVDNVCVETKTKIFCNLEFFAPIDSLWL